MNCPDRLEEYQTGSEEIPGMEAHLRDCADCRSELDQIRSLEEDLRAAGEVPVEPEPDVIREKVHNLERHAQRWRSWKEVLMMSAASILLVGIGFQNPSTASSK